jgi:hypothetical protein
VPPFAGFFTKFLILCSLAVAKFEITLLFLITAILIGTFIYLRFLKISLFEPAKTLNSYYQTVHISTVDALMNLTKQAYLINLRASRAFYSIKISKWHEKLLIVSAILFNFLFGFIGFLSLYLTGVFELTLGLLLF